MDCLDVAVSMSDWTDRDMAQAKPLYSGGITPRQVEIGERMDNVFGAMRPGDVSVLQAKYMKGESLTTIANAVGVSPQAVSKRIDVATQNFFVAFTEHWMDPWGDPGVTENLSEMLP
jgi:hypothetical protein